MWRWIHGVSLIDHIRTEDIREAATVQPTTTHLMQKRLRWYGHVRRIDDSHMTRTVLAGHGGRSCATQRKTYSSLQENPYNVRYIHTVFIVHIYFAPWGVDNV